MVAKAHADEVLGELLLADGETELVAVAEIEGVLCKCRIDRLVQWRGWTVVFDLKTTTNASRRGGRNGRRRPRAPDS